MKKDIYLRKALIKKFLTLNDFSQIPFITFVKEDGKLKPTNVSLPNKEFEPPVDSLWFGLNILDDEPESIGLYNKTQERYTGFLQIDICVPLNVGEDEADDVYSFICGLFYVGSTFDDVTINKVCKVDAGVEGKYYKTVVRVYFDADVDNS